MNESTSNTLQPVPFHGDTIYCIDHQNQPFTAMKPIAENLGLAWQSQLQKLNANKERWGITMIVIPSQSGNQDMVCMPVRKLPAYLNTINPKKVSEKLREKIVRYQEESDDVLWAYWTEHRQAVPPAALPAPVAPADTADEITRELCAMIRQNMDGKTLAEKIAVWSRVTGALDGQNPSGPKAAETSLMKQSELWPLAQGRKAGTEIAVADALKKALSLLDTAFQTSGFLDRGTTAESVRHSLVIACRCNIDAAGAIARALIASDGKPKLAAA